MLAGGRRYKTPANAAAAAILVGKSSLSDTVAIEFSCAVLASFIQLCCREAVVTAQGFYFAESFLGWLHHGMFLLYTANIATLDGDNIPVTIGTIAFGIMVISASAALSARETCRVRLDGLGNKVAVPMDKAEYDRMRENELAGLAQAGGFSRVQSR